MSDASTADGDETVPGVSGSAQSDSPQFAGGLLRTSTVMAVGTTASRALGFARSAALAAAIGVHLTSDTFTVANTVPNIIYILLAGGVLNAVFVPQLVRAMKDPDGGQGYADRLLTLAGLVLLGVTIAATALAPVLMAIFTSGYSSADLAVATAFAFWCLPQIFFYGVYTLVGQVLNARGSFGPMMWAPTVNNVVAITGALAFLAFYTVNPRDPSSLSTAGIALLGATATLGVALQALVLIPVLRRTGFRYRPRFDFRGHGLGKAGELAKWTLLFVLVNQLAYLVIVNLATNAATSRSGEDFGLTVYSNAFLIFILPHSILTVSVVTGLLPRMSRAVADGRLDAVRDDLSTGWRLTAVGTVFVAALFVALGPDLTGVLFAANNKPVDARFIGTVTAAFALGLPAFSAQYVALRGFYAQEDTRTPFLLQVVIAATNVVLALAAYALLPERLALVGLALAYAATYVVGLALSTAVLRRRLGGVDGRRVTRTVVRLVLAVLPGAIAAWGFSRALTGWLGEGFVGSAVALGTGGVVLLLGFLTIGRALHIDELATVSATVRPTESPDDSKKLTHPHWRAGRSLKAGSATADLGGMAGSPFRSLRRPGRHRPGLAHPPRAVLRRRRAGPVRRDLDRHHGDDRGRPGSYAALQASEAWQTNKSVQTGLQRGRRRRGRGEPGRRHRHQGLQDRRRRHRPPHRVPHRHDADRLPHRADQELGARRAPGAGTQRRLIARRDPAQDRRDSGGGRQHHLRGPTMVQVLRRA